MNRTRPNRLYYRIAQVVSWFVATFVYHRKIRRNELRGKKGPFVVIANHESMLDFVNLIGTAARPMSFVISYSIFSTLPIKRFLLKMGVIPKQQFQSTASDLKKMKRVIEDGGIVTIYPAGLMCEDGMSTPIPAATYKFLKWLGVDVYMARTQGAYFVMPKWSKKIRPGRTYMDIYQLFTAQELAQMDVDAVREKAEAALLFDSYREQEKNLTRFKNGDDIEGLENVLYQCPCCKQEFTMKVKDTNTIYCGQCGFEQVSDRHGFLHNHKGTGEELRYVSDWSKWIYTQLKESIARNPEYILTAQTQIHMVDQKTDKFVPSGEGEITLSQDGFVLDGTLHGQQVNMQISIAELPTLPFSPGRYIEIQNGKEIYRCVLENGVLAMKYINMVKIFHENKEKTRSVRRPAGVK